MKELIPALIKARRQFKPIKKDKTNPFFKSKYADLDSVLESVNEALNDNGLLVSQSVSLITLTENGEISPLPILTTTLWHESGESLESAEYPLPRTDDPQKLGSAITYARRYQLCALLNITAEDDDGNSSSSSQRPAAAATNGTRTLSKEEWEKLRGQR